MSRSSLFHSFIFALIALGAVNAQTCTELNVTDKPGCTAQCATKGTTSASWMTINGNAKCTCGSAGTACDNAPPALYDCGAVGVTSGDTCTTKCEENYVSKNGFIALGSDLTCNCKDADDNTILYCRTGSGSSSGGTTDGGTTDTSSATTMPLAVAVMPILAALFMMI